MATIEGVPKRPEAPSATTMPPARRIATEEKVVPKSRPSNTCRPWKPRYASKAANTGNIMAREVSREATEDDFMFAWFLGHGPVLLRLPEALEVLVFY
jgi:hypothetical protein